LGPPATSIEPPRIEPRRAVPAVRAVVKIGQLSRRRLARSLGGHGHEEPGVADVRASEIIGAGEGGARYRLRFVRFCPASIISTPVCCPVPFRPLFRDRSALCRCATMRGRLRRFWGRISYFPVLKGRSLPSPALHKIYPGERAEWRASAAQGGRDRGHDILGEDDCRPITLGAIESSRQREKLISPSLCYVKARIGESCRSRPAAPHRMPSRTAN
jgi:hypothetical protein